MITLTIATVSQLKQVIAAMPSDVVFTGSFNGFNETEKTDFSFKRWVYPLVIEIPDSGLTIWVKNGIMFT